MSETSYEARVEAQTAQYAGEASLLVLPDIELPSIGKSMNFTPRTPSPATQESQVAVDITQDKGLSK